MGWGAQKLQDPYEADRSSLVRIRRVDAQIGLGRRGLHPDRVDIAVPVEVVEVNTRAGWRAGVIFEHLETSVLENELFRGRSPGLLKSLWRVCTSTLSTWCDPLGPWRDAERTRCVADEAPATHAERVSRTLFVPAWPARQPVAVVSTALTRPRVPARNTYEPQFVERLLSEHVPKGLLNLSSSGLGSPLHVSQRVRIQSSRRS